MLLSFSEPAMLPMIEAGIAETGGTPAKGRVKRQTLRKRGPWADILLAQLRPDSYSHPGTLHLWWKSRTKERAALGVVKGFKLFALTIKHYQNGDVKIKGPGHSAAVWDANGSAVFREFARADGFDSPEAFRDYFVPSPGDEFDGVLFKW